MSAPVPKSILRKKLRLRRIRMEKHMANLGPTVIGRKIYTPQDMLNNWQRHALATLKGLNSEETKTLRNQSLAVYLLFARKKHD